MKLRPIALLALPLLVCAGAWGQAPKGAFKDKVKPGLYEVRTEADMGNMPGVPPDKKKQVTTRKECITAASMDSFTEEKDRNCQTRDFRMTGGNASFQVVCKGNGEMTSNVTMTFKPSGYVTDSKVTMKPASGPAINLSQHAESKYLGPCPKKQ